MNIRLGEAAQFPLGQTVTWLSSNSGVVEVDREGDSVVFRGIGDGRAVVFFVDGLATRAVTVNVGRAIPNFLASRRAAVSAEDEFKASLDRSLRYSTGGLLERGSLELQHQRGTTGAGTVGIWGLSGHSGLLDYAMNARHAQTSSAGGGLGLDNAYQLLLRHPFARLHYGPIQFPTEFESPRGLQPDRDLMLRLGPEKFNVALSTRGQAIRTGAFSPEAVRLAVRGLANEWLSLSGGTIMSLSREPSFLPFVSAFLSTRWGTLDGAAGSNGAWSEQGALALSLKGDFFVGDCKGMATLVHNSAAQELDFASFATERAGRVIFGGSCSLAGGRSVRLSFMRDDGMQRLANEIGVLTAGYSAPFGVWNFGTHLRWSVAPLDTRQFGFVTAELRRENEELGMSYGGSVSINAGGGTAMSERFFVQKGWTGLSVSGGLAFVHSGVTFPVVMASAAATWRPSSQNLSMNASVASFLAGSPTGPLQPMVSGGISWFPHPVWSMGVQAQANVGTTFWLMSGVLSYNFGDALPRDPLLAPFRSEKLRVRVFEDPNRNGVFEPGEPLLEGVDVCVGVKAQQRCVPTGPSGEVLFDDLETGFHDVTVPIKRFVGAVPTTASTASVAVGAYSESKLEVGIRFRGSFKLRVVADVNGNGTADPDDLALAGTLVTVVGPSMKRRLNYVGGDREFEWTEKGPYLFRLDPLSLPPGYLAGPESWTIAEAETFEAVPVVLLVKPVRSIAGRACLDLEGNKRCDASDPPVGLVRVQMGELTLETDADGYFRGLMLPPGEYRPVIPELDVPAGYAQKVFPEVNLTAKPEDIRGIHVTLQPEAKAKRKSAVVMEWPLVGTATANELGAHFMDASAIAAAPEAPVSVKGRPAKAPPLVEPIETDKLKLRELMKLLKQKKTKVFITVTRPQRPNADESEEAAQIVGSNLARWLVRELGVPVADIVTEIAPNTSSRPFAQVRVFQLRAKL